MRAFEKSARGNIGCRLEDLHDLEEAIAEYAGKPLIPWEEAKKDLDLD